MIKTFTKDDLIRYLYHETSEKESREIKKALLCDAELRMVYADLCTLKKELDQSGLEPSDQTVARILDHARKTSVQKQ